MPFARSRSVVAAALAVLVFQAAGARAQGNGVFAAHLALQSNLADPGHVLPGTPVVVTVDCEQSYAPTNPGDNTTRIQLNWTDSSGDFAFMGDWAWSETVLDSTLTYAGENGEGDEVWDDGIVDRQGVWGTRFDSPFVIGTLRFDAPAFVEGGQNTYTLTLAGGHYDLGTLSTIADGTTYLLAEGHPGGGGLTLDDWAFTVSLPHPGDTQPDDTVDGADYTTWADNYRLQAVPQWCEGGWSFGNFTNDYVVDGADYTIWADNYGWPGTGVPVPEPEAVIILGFAGLGCMAGRRGSGPRARI